MKQLLTVLVLAGILATAASADVKSQAAKEAAEFIMRKFGKEAVGVSAETLTRKIEILIARYGDEAVTVVKKVGPRAITVVEQAGEHGGQALKVMARFGDDAIWVASKPNRLAIFVRYGDDAAATMIRHGEVVEPLLEKFGKPAATALSSVTEQNGRRLATLELDGDLAKIGRTPEVLDVVGQYGDKAMAFVWNNKGALAVGTTLAAFLADPKPFVEGMRDVVTIPLEKAVDTVGVEIGRRTNWTLVILVALSIVSLVAIVYLRTRFVRTGNDVHRPQ